MRPVEIFKAAVPELLASAQARDHRVGILTRQALRDVWHYHCPIGLRVDKAWVFVIAEKLESPNRYRAHWSLQNSARAKWEKRLQAVICAAVNVASWEWLGQLGRRPACTEKMVLQIVRLVGSSREFIRDDDNLAFSRKGSTDAMKHCGLLKEDRREWLEALSIYQDVAPNGRALTVFYLWPAAADLFTSASGASPCSPSPFSSMSRNPPAISSPTATSAPRSRAPRSSLIP